MSKRWLVIARSVTARQIRHVLSMIFDNALHFNCRNDQNLQVELRIAAFNSLQRDMAPFISNLKRKFSSNDKVMDAVNGYFEELEKSFYQKVV